MNIFYLSHDPWDCARQHCNKHVVKMITETAQLLSTAHRVLDGEEEYSLSLVTRSGRARKVWVLEKPWMNVLYQASHIKHPGAIWSRESEENYQWLYKLFVALSDEYTYRYHKIHAAWKQLAWQLSITPEGIGKLGWREPPQCMPEQYKHANTIEAYRQYYIGEKARFAKYTGRNPPEWLAKYLQLTQK